MTEHYHFNGWHSIRAADHLENHPLASNSLISAHCRGGTGTDHGRYRHQQRYMRYSVEMNESFLQTPQRWYSPPFSIMLRPNSLLVGLLRAPACHQSCRRSAERINWQETGPYQVVLGKITASIPSLTLPAIPVDMDLCTAA